MFLLCNPRVLCRIRRIRYFRRRGCQLFNQRLGHHGWVLNLSQPPPSIDLVSHHPYSSRVGQIASQLHRYNLNDIQVTRFRPLRCHLHKNLITISHYLTSHPWPRVLSLLRRDISHPVIPHCNLLRLHSQHRHPLYTHRRFQWGAY